MQTSNQLQSFYPVIQTRQVGESADFYRKHFPFETTFEADWYVSLIWKDPATGNPGPQMAILAPDHASVPEPFRKPVSGLILNFEVADVDAEYNRLSAAGLPMHRELKSEDWGQRHFITADPNGVLIDMIQLIPPSEEFAKLYGAKALETVNNA